MDTRWTIGVFLIGGLAGALLVAPAFSLAQAPPVNRDECERWAISQWSPKEDGDCSYRGRSPYTHRNEWCQAPQGAKIIDSINVGKDGNLGVGGDGDTIRFWVKRCVER